MSDRADRTQPLIGHCPNHAGHFLGRGTPTFPQHHPSRFKAMHVFVLVILENVMMCDPEDLGSMKLTDLGLSTQLDSAVRDANLHGTGDSV